MMGQTMGPNGGNIFFYDDLSDDCMELLELGCFHT